MIYLHFLAAVLASWRLTELFVHDRITHKLRMRANTYLLSCPYCMSVWTGAWVTLILALGLKWPLLLWLNWPFAIAWLYRWHMENTLSKRLKERGRELKIILSPDGRFHFNSELAPQESIGAMQMVMQQLGRSISPPSTPVAATPPGPLANLSDGELNNLSHLKGGTKPS